MIIKELTPFAVFIVFLSIAIEAIYSYKKEKNLYDLQDSWVSVLLGVLGAFFRALTKGVGLVIWYFLYGFSILKIESSFYSFLILFILHEFVYYWYHRFSHEVPFFWATHVNHHSSLKMNISVSLRTPFLNVFYFILFWIPLVIIGFHPLDVLLVQLLGLSLSFIQHTTLIGKLGILESVLSTPSHHRVHHASNEQYINKNYGSVLIIFDKLFGTFEEEREDPVYGVTKNPKNRRALNMIFHGWVDYFKGNKF